MVRREYCKVNVTRGNIFVRFRKFKDPVTLKRRKTVLTRRRPTIVSSELKKFRVEYTVEGTCISGLAG